MSDLSRISNNSMKGVSNVKKSTKQDSLDVRAQKLAEKLNKEGYPTKPNFAPDKEIYHTISFDFGSYDRHERELASKGKEVYVSEHMKDFNGKSKLIFGDKESINLTEFKTKKFNLLKGLYLKSASKNLSQGLRHDFSKKTAVEEAEHDYRKAHDHINLMKSVDRDTKELFEHDSNKDSVLTKKEYLESNKKKIEQKYEEFVKRN